MANLQNPVKAIRAKCLDCCCGNQNEVRLCAVVGCALYPFRFGTNPYRTKREVSAERLEQLRQNMALARRVLSTNQEETDNRISEGNYTPTH